MTLSSLVTLLIDTYFPEAYQNYLCLNYMQTSQYRAYKACVPEYLRERPRSTIVHCLTRKSKALKYSTEDIQMVLDKNGVFEVNGSNGKVHTVNFGLDTPDDMPECSCADWMKWHIPCKHFFGVFHVHPEWGWYKLPQRYLTSCYLTIDQTAITDYFGQDTSAEVTDPADEENPPSASDIPQRKVCFLNFGNSTRIMVFCYCYRH